ncbi:hypothetical protein FJ366_02405 [Candidatus Dependentiae bacterium]|nr:hypothetical protein [Candidatus Dependentiae bacterium]
MAKLNLKNLFLKIIKLIFFVALISPGRGVALPSFMPKPLFRLEPFGSMPKEGFVGNDFFNYFSLYEQEPHTFTPSPSDPELPLIKMTRTNAQLCATCETYQIRDPKTGEVKCGYKLKQHTRALCNQDDIDLSYNKPLKSCSTTPSGRKYVIKHPNKTETILRDCPECKTFNYGYEYDVLSKRTTPGHCGFDIKPKPAKIIYLLGVCCPRRVKRRIDAERALFKKPEQLIIEAAVRTETEAETKKKSED